MSNAVAAQFIVSALLAIGGALTLLLKAETKTWLAPLSIVVGVTCAWATAAEQLLA